jgi:hypothetical protein
MIACKPDLVALLDCRTVTPTGSGQIDRGGADVRTLLGPRRAFPPAAVIAIQDAVDPRESGR